jgi:inhibitor of KinA sporulation pathway (predicted exonuclease)
MKYYIITDLEWTSWKGNYTGKYKQYEKRSKKQKKEIIQIGAIKINEKFKIIKKINIYIKPRINPILSKYIIKLTGITQKTIVKKGLDFKNAFKIFSNFIKKNKIICNGSDEKIMNENLLLNLINKKVKFFNIKSILTKNYKIPEKYSSSPIIQSYFGYKIKKNKMHNALYDCISILKALRKIKFNFNLYIN